MKYLSGTEQVIELAKQVGFLRPRDLEARGLARVYLSRLCARGILEKAGRGLYRLKRFDNIGVNHSLAEVSKRIPNGIICLLSALRFHELTTELPGEVWLAIDYKARLPREGEVATRIVRFSGEALKSGYDEHVIEGIKVKVYGPAKTVADCFKYRNKIGLAVALEALRDCRRQGKCSSQELWRYAQICRVANVMRPYLEATQ